MAEAAADAAESAYDLVADVEVEQRARTLVSAFFSCGCVAARVCMGVHAGAEGLPRSCVHGGAWWAHVEPHH